MTESTSADRDAKMNEKRREREASAAQQARERGRPVTYIDDDGCEVTVLVTGDVFYNAIDWY